MNTKRFIAFGAFALIATVALALAPGTQAQENTSYEVTVTNLTSGQPFTPPVVVAHTDGLEVFEVGSAASAEVQAIAENGNNEPLVTLLGGSDAVIAHTSPDGPIPPGESATVSIDAPAGSLLSVVFMLICTNDGFAGVDSITLPASGSETTMKDAYDAGTENNTEDFADIVPPCQEVIGVMSDDDGTGESNPALAEGGTIAAHAGIQGGTDLTVDDHGWTDPVVEVTVTAAGGDTGGTMLPASGTGFEAGSSTGWLLYAALAGAALAFAVGALSFARGRTTR